MYLILLPAPTLFKPAQLQHIRSTGIPAVCYFDPTPLLCILPDQSVPLLVPYCALLSTCDAQVGGLATDTS